MMELTPEELITLKGTHKLWNRVIFRVLSNHSQGGASSARLTSFQLHALAAEFDPTQNRPWVSTAVERANTWCTKCGKRVYGEPDMSMAICECNK